MKGGLYIEKKQEENRREEITSKSLKLGFPGGPSGKEPACQYRRHKRQITYLYGEGDGTHSSTLAWKIPWIEEPGRLQSMGSLGVGHD